MTEPYRGTVPLRECVHCQDPVMSDGRGGWVHVGGSYACRDESNVLIGTYAEPQPQDWSRHDMS